MMSYHFNVFLIYKAISNPFYVVSRAFSIQQSWTESWGVRIMYSTNGPQTAISCERGGPGGHCAGNLQVEDLLMEPDGWA